MVWPSAPAIPSRRRRCRFSATIARRSRGPLLRSVCCRPLVASRTPSADRATLDPRVARQAAGRRLRRLRSNALRTSRARFDPGTTCRRLLPGAARRVAEERRGFADGERAQDSANDGSAAAPEVPLRPPSVRHVAPRAAADENLGAEFRGAIEQQDGSRRVRPPGENPAVATPAAPAPTMAMSAREMLSGLRHGRYGRAVGRRGRVGDFLADRDFFGATCLVGFFFAGFFFARCPVNASDSS